MQHMATTLQTLLHACHGAARPDCPILADLRSACRARCRRHACGRVHDA
jgi:hypothetical protein